MRWMHKLREEVEVARSLFPLLRNRPWGLGGLVALGVLASLAEGFSVSLFIPFLRSMDAGESVRTTGNWLVDSLAGLFTAVPAERRLLVIALAIFALLVLVSLLRYAYDMVFAWMDVRIGHRLRSGIYAQLLAVGYGFLERSEFGRLLNTLSTETWRTSSALATLVGLFIAVCTAAVYIALLLLLSWKLTLLVLVGLTLISMIARALTQRVKQLGAEATEANAALSQRMMEGLGGMKVIRTFVRESYEQRRFDRASEEVTSVFWRLGLLSGIVTPVYEVLAAVLLVSVLYVSLQNTANLPILLVFIFVLYRLRPRIQSLDAARVRLTSLAASVRDVMGLAPGYFAVYRNIEGSMSTDCRSMEKSYDLVIERAREAHPEMPNKVFRWSRSVFNGYLAAVSYANRKYALALRLMWDAVRADPAVLLGRNMLRMGLRSQGLVARPLMIRLWPTRSDWADYKQRTGLDRTRTYSLDEIERELEEREVTPWRNSRKPYDVVLERRWTWMTAEARERSGIRHDAAPHQKQG